MNKTVVFLLISLIFSSIAIASNVAGAQAASASPAANPMMVGSDRDAHGCIPSAGYSWCPVLNQCARVWEHPECNPAESGGGSMPSLIATASAGSCVNENLSEELNSLFSNLKEAEQNNDTGAYAQIKDEIRNVTAEIESSRRACQINRTIEPISAPPGVSVSAAVAKIRICNDVGALEEQISYYENLTNGTNSPGQNEAARGNVTARLAELRAMLENRTANCSNITKVNLGVLVSQAVKNKEGGAGDIVAYYKMKLSDVVSSNATPDGKISSLKQLRNEIDNMIEDLIKKNQRINSSDIGSVVSEIAITPGQIRADSVSVDSENKTIEASVGNDTADITANNASVILTSGGVSADAREIRIENNTLKVGNHSVRVLPSEIAARIRMTPKNITLVDESSRAVYMIKADENRKFLGIISVKVEKDISMDSSSGDILSQNSQWWAFLTTSS